MKSCVFPGGIKIYPNGKYPLEAHKYRIAQEHKNVDVFSFECKVCKDNHIFWSRTGKTESWFADDDDRKPKQENTRSGPHMADWFVVYHNVTVEILKCDSCGHISVGWNRQPDTYEYTVNAPIDALNG